MAAPSSGLELVPSPVATSGDIERVIESLGRIPNGGIILPPESTTVDHRNRIIDLTALHRVPAAYSLRGDKPADLPVQEPTRFETAVNVKTAKALGLTVPYGLLLAADELIE